MRTGVVGTRERAGFGHPARAGSTPSGGAAPRRCRSTCPCSPRAPGPRATAQRRGRRPPGRSPGVLVGHDGPPRSRHPPQRGALCQPVTTKIQPRRETQDEGWTGGFGRRPPRQESVAGAAARRHRKVKNTGRLGRHPSLRARSIAWTSQRPPEPRTWVRIPAGPSPYTIGPDGSALPPQRGRSPPEDRFEESRAANVLAAGPAVRRSVRCHGQSPGSPSGWLCPCATASSR